MIRKEKGWTQQQMADHLFVTRQTVSNWETEKSYPDVHSLLILSDLFGVSLDELIKGDVAVMKEQVKSKSWQEGIGIPYASTWLNNRRWEDEIKIPPAQEIDTRGGLEQW